MSNSSGIGGLVAAWMAANPFSDRVPEWLITPCRPISPLPAAAVAAAEVMACHSEIDRHVNASDDGTRTSFRRRRVIGAQVADYLAHHGLLSLDHRLKLRACRHGGFWGIDTGTGKKIVAWDSKCGQALLCPHCARTEQRRLVRRYKQPMKKWKQAKSTRRIHSGVITWPNVAPDRLAEYLRLIFKHFSKLKRDFPSIKGSLATVESPLSRRGDWNLHLNVLLCVDGPLHWGDLRAAWHRRTVHLFPGYEGTSFQIEMRQLPRYDDDALDAALRELIKYPAKHVMEVMHGKKESAVDRHRNPGSARGGAAMAGVRVPLGGTRPRDAHRDGDEPLLVRPDRAAGPGAADRGEDRGSRTVDRDAADLDAGIGRAPSVEGIPGVDRDKRTPADDGHDAGAAGEDEGRGESGAGDDGGRDVEAPALIAWPPERFQEWWDGHRHYRRTRSYGCLFGKPLAELSGDIEDRPRGEAIWYGRLAWDSRAQAYAVECAGLVGSIQANKSMTGDRPSGGNYQRSRTGMPAPGQRRQI